MREQMRNNKNTREHRRKERISILDLRIELSGLFDGIFFFLSGNNWCDLKVFLFFRYHPKESE